MGYLLRINPEAGDAYLSVQIDPTETGEPGPDWWFTIEAKFPAASLANLVASGGGWVISTGPYPPPFPFSPVDALDLCGISGGTWATSIADGAVPGSPDEWVTLELHHVEGGACEFIADGGAPIATQIAGAGPVRYVHIGLTSSFDLSPSLFYIRRFKLGTTRGAGDLMDEDFSGGDLSPYLDTDSPTGDVELVPDRDVVFGYDGAGHVRATIFGATIGDDYWLDVDGSSNDFRAADADPFVMDVPDAATGYDPGQVFAARVSQPSLSGFNLSNANVASVFLTKGTPGGPVATDAAVAWAYDGLRTITATFDALDTVAYYLQALYYTFDNSNLRFGAVEPVWPDPAASFGLGVEDGDFRSDFVPVMSSQPNSRKFWVWSALGFPPAGLNDDVSYVDGGGFAWYSYPQGAAGGTTGAVEPDWSSGTTIVDGTRTWHRFEPVVAWSSGGLVTPSPFQYVLVRPTTPTSDNHYVDYQTTPFATDAVSETPGAGPVTLTLVLKFTPTVPFTLWLSADTWISARLFVPGVADAGRTFEVDELSSPGTPAPRWIVEHRSHAEFMPDGDDGTTTDAGTDELIETVYPENLHFRLQLGTLGPGEVSYELSKGALNTDGDPAISGPDFVGPYRTDFVLRRDDLTDPIMAGMHTLLGGADSGETPNESAQIAGKDWLHYLEKRRWPYDAALSYVNWPDGFRFRVTAAEIGQIVRDILETVRDLSANFPAAPDPPGGTNPSYSLGYTVDADDTGTNRNYEISPFESSSIYDLIATLAGAGRERGGFDFLMTFDKVFRLIYPEVGDGPDAPAFTLEVDVATHLANMLETGFTNTGPTATHVLGVGAGTSTRQGGVNRHFRASSAVFRRLDDVADFGEVKNLDALEDLTGSSLALGSNPVHAIPIRVDPSTIPGFWDVCRPGVYIAVDYDFGWHRINSVQRVTAMECDVDLEGAELVELELNQFYDTSPDAGLDEF